MAEQKEHRVIYLEPSCCSEAGEDRHWCQDDAWGACDECGTKSVKYIIASDHEAMVKALKDIKHVSRKDSLTDAERLESVRVILSRVGGES
jgi:hypothetical protein